MGIRISYSGKLDERRSIEEFVADMESLASFLGWPCHDVAQVLEDRKFTFSGLKGITLLPHPECEPLHLHLDPEGTFVNYEFYSLVHDEERFAWFTKMMVWNDEQLKKLGITPGQHGALMIPDLSAVDPREGVGYNWTKTQFAPPRIHIAICELLSYIQQAHASALEVTDDSGYFAHRDVSVLERELTTSGYYIQALGGSLSSDPDRTERVGACSIKALLDELSRRINKARNELN